MDHMEFEEEIKDAEYFERQIIELAERISDLEDEDYFEKKVKSIEMILKENQILLNELKNDLRNIENDK